MGSTGGSENDMVQIPLEQTLPGSPACASPDNRHIPEIRHRIQALTLRRNHRDPDAVRPPYRTAIEKATQ